MRKGLVALVAVFALAGCVQAPVPSSDDSAAPHASSPGASPSQGLPSPQQGPAPNQARFKNCAGSGTVMFANAPMRAEDFEYLLPYGLLAGAHVTPIDHMYFSVPMGSARDAYEVRAIADGVIFELQPRDINVDQNTAKAREWRIDFAHTCTFTSYFDLLTSIDPALESAWKAGTARGTSVKAGQVIGRIGGQTLDFGVYDYAITLPGFVVPAHYEREPWKIHTVDPFPYFDESTRTLLLSRMMRQAEPRAGKIDLDVDGKLVGNWFQVGTNGYGGAPGRWDYWDGHFAFVYDAIDPSQLRFSVGNWSGRPQQFGVIGNAPDPSMIGPESGPVKLELAYASCLATNRAAYGFGPGGIRAGDSISCAVGTQVLGSALVQMLGPRSVRMEVFPGLRAADVTGFTASAREYER